MGYPGDQGKPDGWPPQPSQAPYGSGPERPDTAPYGQDKNESPFSPRDSEGTGGLYTPWGEEAPAENEWFSPQGTAQFSNEGFDGGAPPGAGVPPQAGPVPPDRKYNLPLIIGGAVVAGLVLVGGGFGASAMLKDDEPTKPAAATKSDAPKQATAPRQQPSQPPLTPVKLKSRATDPNPMTLNEAFGKRTFASGGAKYMRTGWKAQRGCTGIVNGAALGKALKKGGCSQALRATFARSDGKLIGTVGVLNLKTEAAAKVAERAAAAKDAYLQPLAGTGTTKKIGKGEALGTAEIRGHYLVMTWVQRPDGKKIATKYHKAVSTFGQEVIRGSNLKFALTYRETEGKPFRN
ncbi:hypothetical protein [Actinomadura rudentiformis]|uniref:Uncharacterized protein n=1 Tax=Actinomadura rudentiformis TaxID=359158 RepID=A0A6H9YZ20_9ACTN|nr:hypothetical protein [Actinomadura rudentiformis]KAB2351803.1 hypothetical protein F8566_06235 [Actinomadura rudentiformis]